jgi:hypothetical protein
VQPGEVGEQLGQPRRREVLDQPDAAVPGQGPSGAHECLDRQGENPFGVRQEGLSRSGQRDSGGGPVQQWSPDPALEAAQFLAQRGLGLAQGRRGAADAAGPGGRHERP